VSSSFTGIISPAFSIDWKTVPPLRNPGRDLSLQPGASLSRVEAAEECFDLDQLFSLAYEELRRLASSVKRADASATINPTALVNEAWLKLANSPSVAPASRLHFKRIAARAMRQLLIEAARRRNSHKRGDGVQRITFDESISQAYSQGEELLALDAALQELGRIQPRQALMVESRFFGGLDISETAALLGVSEATILRDWRAAKAWLAHTLRKEH
jgi:RNA polymerase sigma factor (TIGR02999 family)